VGIAALAVICLVVWGGIGAASPEFSDNEATTQAVQRGFIVTDVQAQPNRSQKMSVRFGTCTGTFYLGGGRDVLESKVISGVTVSDVAVNNPTVSALRENPVFKDCFK
jgi:hypothetical protein